MPGRLIILPALDGPGLVGAQRRARRRSRRRAHAATAHAPRPSACPVCGAQRRARRSHRRRPRARRVLLV